MPHDWDALAKRWPKAAPPINGGRHHLVGDKSGREGLCGVWGLATPATDTAERRADLCKTCLARAWKLLRGMTEEELEGLRHGDWLRHLNTGKRHRVEVTEGREEDARISCSGDRVSWYLDRYRPAAADGDGPVCERCAAIEKGAALVAKAETPEPLAKIGEFVTFHGVSGSYVQPIPGGHMIRTWQGDQKVKVSGGGS
jgi:hypothetical protein